MGCQIQGACHGAGQKADRLHFRTILVPAGLLLGGILNLAPVPAEANFLKSAYCKANPWYCAAWTSPTITGGSRGFYPFDVNGRLNTDENRSPLLDTYTEISIIKGEIDKLKKKRKILLRKLYNKLDEQSREQEKANKHKRNKTKGQEVFNDVFGRMHSRNVRIIAKEADAIAAKSQALEVKINSKEQEKTQLEKQYKALTKDSGAHDQVMSGLPPDADFLYRLGNMSWWVNSDVRFTDESTGPRLNKGTLFNSVVGADMKLGDNGGIGFGIGYGRSNLTQTDAFGGGKLTSDGLNLLLRGYKGPSANFLFDASLSYGYARLKNTRPTLTDTYSTHAFGYGFGVNLAHDFTALWRAEGRLGWSGSSSIRKASVDSSGFAIGRMVSHSGTASLSGRLLRKFSDGSGYLFADGALNAITNDTVSSFNSQPFHGEFGAGVNTKLGSGLSLTARGFAGAIGRKNREEYGGSIKLGLEY